MKPLHYKRALGKYIGFPLSPVVLFSIIMSTNVISQQLIKQEPNVALQRIATTEIEHNASPNTSPNKRYGSDMLYMISVMPMVILTWIQFAFNLFIMMTLF